MRNEKEKAIGKSATQMEHAFSRGQVFIIVEEIVKVVIKKKTLIFVSIQGIVTIIGYPFGLMCLIKQGPFFGVADSQLLELKNLVMMDYLYYYSCDITKGSLLITLISLIVAVCGIKKIMQNVRKRF